MRNRFWLIFVVLTSVTNLNGNFLRVQISIGTKRLLETQFFEKKALWPLFSRIIEHDKCQGTFYILRGSRLSFDKYCASYEFVSRGPERLLKTQIFGEKRQIF